MQCFLVVDAFDLNFVHCGSQYALLQQLLLLARVFTFVVEYVVGDLCRFVVSG